MLIPYDLERVNEAAVADVAISAKSKQPPPHRGEGSTGMKNSDDFFLSLALRCCCDKEVYHWLNNIILSPLPFWLNPGFFSIP